MNISELIVDIAGFLPECALLVTALLALVVDRLTRRERPRIVGLIAVVGTVASALLLVTQAGLLVYPNGEPNPFGAEWLFRAGELPQGFGSIVVDGVAVFIKSVVALAAVVAQLAAMGPTSLRRAPDPRRGRIAALMLMMTFGMFVTAGADDLLVLWIGLDLTWLALWGIVGGTHADARVDGRRALVAGAVTSAMMLVGVALLYGLMGSTNVAVIGIGLGAPNTENVLRAPLAIASLLVFAGAAVKAGMLPLQILGGERSGALVDRTPLPALVIACAAGTAAGTAGLLHFIVVGYAETMQGFRWAPVLAGASMALTTLSTIAALRQPSLRHTLVRLSVAHGGLLLAALAVGTPGGAAALLIAAACGSVAFTGALYVAGIVESLDGNAQSGGEALGRRRRGLAIMLTIFLLSLAGAPLTAGFPMRFYLFTALAAGGSGFVWLMAGVAVNTLLAAVIVARILMRIWFGGVASAGTRPEVPIAESVTAFGPAPGSAPTGLDRFIVAALALATVALGVPPCFAALEAVADGALRGVMPYLHDVALTVLAR